MRRHGEPKHSRADLWRNRFALFDRPRMFFRTLLEELGIHQMEGKQLGGVFGLISKNASLRHRSEKD